MASQNNTYAQQSASVSLDPKSKLIQSLSDISEINSTIDNDLNSYIQQANTGNGLTEESILKNAPFASSIDNILKTPTDWQSYGFFQIDHRIESLNNVINWIEDNDAIIPNDKLWWEGYVQHGFISQAGSIKAMKKLRITIAEDYRKKDMQSLQKDVNAIVAENRVYYVFIPSIYLNIAVSFANYKLDHESDFARASQHYIDQAKLENKDVAELEVLQRELGTPLNDAGTALQNALNAVQEMNPTDYPTFEHKKDSIKNLNNAKNLLHTAAVELKVIYTKLLALYK